MENNFIVHDFKLPNHCNELSKAEDIIEKIKLKIKKLQELNTINNHQHDALFEETVRILDYIGKLSLPAFKIEDELEQLYFKQFMRTPELAKKLWLEHFETIHHPYNILKNRCFKLLDELDELYINVHKKYPPNWSAK